MGKLVDITKEVTAKRGIIVPSQLPQSRRQLHGYQLMLEASMRPISTVIPNEQNLSPSSRRKGMKSVGLLISKA